MDTNPFSESGYVLQVPFAIGFTIIYFVLPAQPENIFNKRMNVSDKKCACENHDDTQVKLIQKSSATNHCAKVAFYHHQRILGQYQIETSSSELFA